VLSLFERVAEGRTAVYVRRETAAWLAPGQALGALEIPAETSGLERGRAALAELSGRKVYLKKYFRGGILGRVLGDRYFSERRFLRELGACERVRREGVSVPVPLALVVKKEGLFTRAWLFTEPVEGTVSLGEALRAKSGAERRRLIRSAGEAVGRMHAAGILHPDLTLENVRADADGAIVLFDFDRASFSTCPVRRRLNLFRLHRSAVKLHLWRGPHAGSERRDLAAFLLGYLGGGKKPSRVTVCAFVLYRFWERFHGLFWKTGHA